MKHQVEFLKSMGIVAEFMSEDQRDEEVFKRPGIIDRLLWDLQILSQ